MRRTSLVLGLIVVSTLLALAQGTDIASAVAIAPNGSASGTITSQNANHYWKVTIPSNAYFRCQLVSVSTIDVNIIRDDTDGSTSITSDTQSGPNSEIIAFLKPGTYFLRLYLWSGTSGTYTLSTSFSSPVRAADTELNNAATSAIALSPTGASTGHLGYYSAGQTDVDDYWKITTTQDGWLRVQVRADSLDARGDRRLDFNVILYDVNGTTSITSDTRYGTFSQVDYFLRPGTYFLRVWHWDGRAGSYEIKSEFFTPPLANDQEGNDSYQSSLSMPVNGSVTGHLGYYGNGQRDNDDYWKFTTTTDGKIVITTVSDSLDRSEARFDLNMIVYDVNGTTSITSDTRYSTVSECIVHLRPGTYYVRLWLWSGNGVSYRISAPQTTPSRANDQEGNDWFATASTLTLDVTSTGHSGYYSNGNTDSEDRWRLLAPSADSVYVHIISDSTIDLNLIALTPDTSSSITSDNRNGTYSRVGIKPTSGSTYYFKVYQWTGTAGSYSIVATRSAATTDVPRESETALIPTELTLDQNYPNPFNPSTTIRFSVAEKSVIRLAVYSLLGQEIAVLADGLLTPSTYTATWNGRDSHGMEVTSGTYLIRLTTGDKQFVRKALLLR